MNTCHICMLKYAIIFLYSLLVFICADTKKLLTHNILVSQGNVLCILTENTNQNFFVKLSSTLYHTLLFYLYIHFDVQINFRLCFLHVFFIQFCTDGSPKILSPFKDRTKSVTPILIEYRKEYMSEAIIHTTDSLSYARTFGPKDLTFLYHELTQRYSNRCRIWHPRL